MLIWRLRRALDDPNLKLESRWQRYTTFTRGYLAREAAGLPVVGAVASLLRGVGLIVLPIGAILFGAPLLVILMFVVFTTSPILVPLAHLLYGGAIAYQVSGSIVREREKGTYDQLCALPPGSVGLHWAHATSWLLDHRALRTLAVVMVLVGTATTLFGSVSLFGLTYTGTSALLFWVLSCACVIALLTIDHYSTQVTATLLGMTLPASVNSISTVRISTVTLFVLVQVSAYLIGVLSAGVVLPTLYRFTNASSEMIALTLPTITLLVFTAYREWIIRRLWAQFRSAVNATPAEMEALC